MHKGSEIPSAVYEISHCTQKGSGITLEECDSDRDGFSEIDDNEKGDVLDTMLDESEPSSHDILSFAPGEGQAPIGLFQDPNVEYMSFPTIFSGQTHADNKERVRPVHYSDICKWELRSVDRRVAQNVRNILFKTKVLETKQIADKATLSMRRCKSILGEEKYSKGCSK